MVALVYTGIALAMQEVVTNLGASKLEFRSDSDPDVAPFTHGKTIEV